MAAPWHCTNAHTLVGLITLACYALLSFAWVVVAKFRTAMLFALLVGLAGCQKEACPELTKLGRANPVADAEAAILRGDRRLLMLGGYVGVIPGAEGTSAPTRMLEGTGDANTSACDAMRPVAEKYALAYNRALLQRQR
jgi:hypothetical protein